MGGQGWGQPGTAGGWQRILGTLLSVESTGDTGDVPLFNLIANVRVSMPSTTQQLACIPSPTIAYPQPQILQGCAERLHNGQCTLHFLTPALSCSNNHHTIEPPINLSHLRMSPIARLLSKLACAALTNAATASFASTFSRPTSRTAGWHTPCPHWLNSARTTFRATNDGMERLSVCASADSQSLSIKERDTS